MHIVAVCPSCGTRYHLEPDMRGKRTRCQNQTCRAIFEVCAETETKDVPAEKPASKPGFRQVSGSVTDLVPLLSAEEVFPAELVTPPPQKARVISERHGKKTPVAAPMDLPAQRGTPGEVVTPGENPAALPEPALDWGPLGEFFKEENAATPSDSPSAESVSESHFESSEAPPPVRVAVSAHENGYASKSVSSGNLAEPSAPRVARHRGWKAIGLMVAAVLCLGAVIFWQYREQQTGNEAQRLELANERYQDHNFEDAAQRYGKLASDFPASPQQGLYRFAEELSGLREPVNRAQIDPDEIRSAYVRLSQFVAGHKGDPLLQRYQSDLWDTFTKLSANLGEAAEEKHDPLLAELAENALHEANEVKPATDDRAEAKALEVRSRLAVVKVDIATWQRRQGVLTRLQAVLDQFTFSGRQAALQAVEEAGLRTDSQVARLLAELPARHRASITYHMTSGGRTALLRDDHPGLSLVVLPVLKDNIGGGFTDQRPLLALVRGVLYAFEPDGSRVRWCRRVSLDSPGLPLRIPPLPPTPELVLTLNPDCQTIVALDAGRGTPVWQHRCRTPCLSRPVVVGKHVYFSTQGGQVEEVETRTGGLLGSFDLGQLLTVGGVRQPRTNLVYFPADSDCVYVLDTAAHKCERILYTDHVPGSIRVAPQVVPLLGRGEDKASRRGLLVLTQDNGLEDTKLRAFPLPVAETGLAPDRWEKSIRGWSCFPPYVDSERIAQVTDAGRFLLFGIGSRFGMPNFFPMVQDEAFLGGGSSPSERPLIVHADAERFWVLADGELHKIAVTFDRQQGPKLVQRAIAEAPLGSALHRAQARVDAEGKAMLFLVTQRQADSTCLATAMDDRGGIAWQRQIGLFCRGQPIRLGDRMLVEDQGGSLYLFGGEDIKEASGIAWRPAGQKLTDSAAVGVRHFLRRPDGSILVVSYTAADPTVLTVQVFQNGPPGPISTFPQQAALAGMPALGTDALVLPLANGVLVRQPLAGGPAAAGPNWRTAYAEQEAPGYVVSLGKDEFLATDGSRGIQRLQWPAGAIADARASNELTSRIIAAPLILPPDPASGERRVCVADAANTVTLLQGENLQPARQWTLEGKITAGPFLRGKAVGCILEQRRLVWLHPDKEQVAWSYGPFLANIVGEPQLVGDGLLVVADVSGHFTGIDAATGQERGKGFTLPGSAAPAASPVPCATGRLFAPLSDGTILLLQISLFRP